MDELQPGHGETAVGAKTNPAALLEAYYTATECALDTPFVSDEAIRTHIEYVCRCVNNRAGARLVLACLLAKLDQPQVDPRKPYTEIGTDDCFSGRVYDEKYLSPFIAAHQLPLNSTTAFLTPALRNINHPLSVTQEIIGTPKDLYRKAIAVLDAVASGGVGVESVFKQVLQTLIRMRNERRARMDSLVATLKHTESALPLSSEAIVTLMSQHLACPHSSRLPVLMISAAYQTAHGALREYALPLAAHNAADSATGAFGDVQICLESDNRLVTVYEMKAKSVMRTDINIALKKIAAAREAGQRIDNYLFVTTGAIDAQVADYARGFYESVGVEIAILDCIGFLRHFLHLFHRARQAYLDNYQALVIAEPDSAVSHALKEVFLTLRIAAESGK
jgi:hypothetical protein